QPATVGIGRHPVGVPPVPVVMPVVMSVRLVVYGSQGRERALGNSGCRRNGSSENYSYMWARSSN
ncbi:hypothetical protein ABT282_16275, partial [Streptomyces sp. NPDC000927]|uniref:hypothetical protein n=1 Tax=Streptomyces sp. NPDC000927 TaxID=3154371 RepID=UPI003323C572